MSQDGEIRPREDVEIRGARHIGARQMRASPSLKSTTRVSSRAHWDPGCAGSEFSIPQPPSLNCRRVRENPKKILPNNSPRYNRNP